MEHEKHAAEINALDLRLKEIEQALEMVDRQLAELQMAKSSIEEIGNLKKETETLVPVGAGIFAKATIKNENNFLVDIGAGAACKKSAEEAKETVESKIERALKLRDRLANEAQIIVQSIMQVEKHLNECSCGE